MLACPHPDAGLLASKHTAEPAEDHVSWRLSLFLTSSNGFVVFCPWFKVSCPTSTHRFVFTLSLFLLYASIAFSPPMCCLQFLRMTSMSSSSALTSLLQQEPSRPLHLVHLSTYLAFVYLVHMSLFFRNKH